MAHTHLTKDFLGVWAKALDKAMQGLDLTDPEDRATFRSRVEADFKNARTSVPKELAQAMGMAPKRPNRQGWARAVADAYIAGKRLPKEARLTERVAERYLQGQLRVRVATRYLRAAYFDIGSIVLYGKYKNHRGKVVGFGQDKWGNPTVEIEPIPKGRKQNKVLGLFRIWRADVKEKALAEQAKEKQNKAR